MKPQLAATVFVFYSIICGKKPFSYFKNLINITILWGFCQNFVLVFRWLITDLKYNRTNKYDKLGGEGGMKND
jgi:hypothetical protein